MTATGGPPTIDSPSLASWSPSEVMAHFLASPTGQRFRACNPLDVWEGLRPAIRLAAAIELAGLGARRALRVHYLGHGFEDARDDGRWLQMAKYFLPACPRLEISMLTAPEVERGRHATASTLSAFVSALSPARRRTAARDALFEPLRGKADLVIVSPRPFIWENDYRAFAEVIPAEVPIVLADESDAATLAVAQFLDEHGASTESRWVDALDDPEAPDDDGDARVVHGALLVHIRQHPVRTPDCDAWRACREMVPWAIRLLMAARKSECSVPFWPGCRFPTERPSGETTDVLFAHPDIYVDATTGEALDLPEGQSFTLAARGTPGIGRAPRSLRGPVRHRQRFRAAIRRCWSSMTTCTHASPSTFRNSAKRLRRSFRWSTRACSPRFIARITKRSSIASCCAESPLISAVRTDLLR